MDAGVVLFTAKAILYGFTGLIVGSIYIKMRFDSCKPRACLDFTCDKNIWEDVETWAGEEGYKAKILSCIERSYWKSGGVRLLIRQDINKVHVEAWVLCNMLIYKREVSIDEFRNKYVAGVNKLLDMLGSQVTLRVI